MSVARGRQAGSRPTPGVRDAAHESASRFHAEDAEDAEDAEHAEDAEDAEHAELAEQAKLAEHEGDEQGAMLLARSARREVVALDVPGVGRCVRKTFLARTPLRTMREALKGVAGRAASQRETRALRGLAAAGVEAPRVVEEVGCGFGTRRLVQSFVEGAPLVDLLADRHARRHVLPRVGDALRRAHVAGWIHGDPHEANVLVHAGEPVWIDWQRSRARGHVRDARVDDIARFEHSMWLHAVPIGDRMRFRRAALGLSERRDDAAARAWLRRVGVAVDRRARSFARVRGRRVMRAEDGRSRPRLPGLRGLRLDEIDDATLRAVLEDHARLDAGCPGDVEAVEESRGEPAGGLVWRRDRRTSWTCVRIGDRRFLVKEERRRAGPGRVVDALFGSAARRDFRAGHELRLRGVASPRPLAWLERRRLGLPVASWLVLESPGDAARSVTLPRRGGKPSVTLRRWPPRSPGTDRSEASSRVSS